MIIFLIKIETIIYKTDSGQLGLIYQSTYQVMRS
jgi:hypothetical protein